MAFDMAALARAAEASSTAPAREGYKMVLCVRQDLGMTAGKMCAQCAHAAVDLVLNAQVADPAALAGWQSAGATKIALKVTDDKELAALHATASVLKVPCTMIADAGRTQVPSGTVTVLGLGPAPISQVDSVTGGLPLL